MRAPSPETVLQKHQPISDKIIGAMLARHGFEYKRTHGSHIFFEHEEFSDEIIGLVHGTHDLIYQKKAAEACLRVTARAQGVIKPVLQHDHHDIELPVHLVSIKRGQESLIHHARYPALGFVYEGPDKLADSIARLDRHAHSYARVLDCLVEDYEFRLEHLADGTLLITHPVYPLDEIVPPFGTDDHMPYPLTTLNYLQNYTQMLDTLLAMHRPGEAPFAHYKFLFDVDTRRTPDGLNIHTLRRTGSWRKAEGDGPTITMTMTPNGRGDLMTAITYLDTAMQAGLWIRKTFTDIGFKYEDDGRTVRVSHEFLNITQTYNSFATVQPQIDEMLNMLVRGKPSAADLSDHLDRLILGLNRVMASMKGNTELNEAMTTEHERSKTEFTSLNRQMVQLGYQRRDYASSDGSRYFVHYEHRDSSFRPLALKTFAPKSGRKNLVVYTHAGMLESMRRHIADCLKPRAGLSGRFFADFHAHGMALPQTAAIPMPRLNDRALKLHLGVK